MQINKSIKSISDKNYLLETFAIIFCLAISCILSTVKSNAVEDNLQEQFQLRQKNKLVLNVDAKQKFVQRSSAHRKRNRSPYSGMVPPPPPMTVTPTTLAKYPHTVGNILYVMPTKPESLAEKMSLVGLMDNFAIFKLAAGQTISLREGGKYNSVTLAEIRSDGVTLKEKGKEIIKNFN